MKKQILVAKNYQDYFVPAFMLCCSIAGFIVFFNAACNKKDVAHQSKITVPVSLAKEGCPYPPGCNAFISQLALAQFRSNDASVSIAYKDSSLQIITTNPGFYKGLSQVNVSPKGLDFVSSISSTAK